MFRLSSFETRAEDEKQGKDGFVTIFDGKTLNGWEATPTQSAWEAKNGAIAGTGDKGALFDYSKNKNVADLERNSATAFPAGVTAVSIRAIPDKTGRRDFQSYHADLGHVGIGGQVLGAWDFHTPGRREHRCFRGDMLVIGKDDKPTITSVKNGLKVSDIKRASGITYIIAKGNNFKLISTASSRVNSPSTSLAKRLRA